MACGRRRESWWFTSRFEVLWPISNAQTQCFANVFHILPHWQSSPGLKWRLICKCLWAVLHREQRLSCYNGHQRRKNKWRNETLHPPLCPCTLWIALMRNCLMLAIMMDNSAKNGGASPSQAIQSAMVTSPELPILLKIRIEWSEAPLRSAVLGIQECLWLFFMIDHVLEFQWNMTWSRLSCWWAMDFASLRHKYMKWHVEWKYCAIATLRIDKSIHYDFSDIKLHSNWVLIIDKVSRDGIGIHSYDSRPRIFVVDSQSMPPYKVDKAQVQRWQSGHCITQRELSVCQTCRILCFKP